jgi:probable HAF family extracellular repeat protein
MTFLLYRRSEMEDTLMIKYRSDYRIIVQLALVACTGICDAAAALPPAYTVTDLGTLGGNCCEGFGINASGHVTGGSYTSGGEHHAFLYDGTMHDLGTLHGNHSSGRGVNDVGQVTGNSSSISDVHAFLYDGTMHDLGTLGGAGSDGRGINNSGHVTGVSGLTGNAIWHAFLYDGEMHDLGTLGGTFSGGWGINDSGQVTGHSNTTGDDFTSTRAFLWTPTTPNGASGAMQDLGTLGGASSEGYGINASGHVTGHSYTAGNAQHAFLYDGTMHDLGTLGGAVSTGLGINASSQVTGWSYTSSGDTHAFVYADGSGMVDLNSLIDSLSGWDLIRGWAINDAGQITGYGTIGGQPRAFLLTPVPEPTSRALLVLGLPLLAGLNMRRSGRDGARGAHGSMAVLLNRGSLRRIERRIP